MECTADFEVDSELGEAEDGGKRTNFTVASVREPLKPHKARFVFGLSLDAPMAREPRNSATRSGLRGGPRWFAARQRAGRAARTRRKIWRAFGVQASEEHRGASAVVVVRCVAVFLQRTAHAEEPMLVTAKKRTAWQCWMKAPNCIRLRC